MLSSQILHSTVMLAVVASVALGAPASVLSSSSTASVVAESETIVAPAPTPTVPLASDDPNLPLWGPDSKVIPGKIPEPIRGQLGAIIIGPENIPLELQNPDLLAPPTTDNGFVGNAKWPFSFSNNLLKTGGWTRQQNAAQMPIATAMSGVNMRLEPGALRELHWHTSAEWAYVLSGHVQITSVDSEGRNYLATVKEGDLWYFPAGFPHSLQATNATADGAEFLLVFPSGDFSEIDTTFQLTDWLAHVPKEVIAKNSQTDISAFDYIPGEQLYIFPSESPADNATAVSDPQGQVPLPYSFSFSTYPVTNLTGGTVKIADSTVFNISQEIAVAEVTVEPGAMRELHWHPTQDEWTFFIEGQARVTLFASSATATTFNYQNGDIAYVPASYGHYVENTGNTTLRYLEIFNTDRYQDVSLSQWLALTPPAIVKAHLNVSDETIAHLSKKKQIVV